MRVYFLGVEDSSLQTSFVVDDVALTTGTWAFGIEPTGSRRDFPGNDDLAMTDSIQVGPSEARLFR